MGDAQDTWLLYINPYTRLVERFLYTVMDRGRANPLRFLRSPSARRDQVKPQEHNSVSVLDHDCLRER